MVGASKRYASRSPESGRSHKRLLTSSPEEGEVDDVPSTSSETLQQTSNAAPPASNGFTNKVKFPFKKKAGDMMPTTSDEGERDESRKGQPPRTRDHWEPAPGRWDDRTRDTANSWRPLYEDRQYYDRHKHPERRRDAQDRSRSSELPCQTTSRSPGSRSRSVSPTSPKVPRHRLPTRHAPSPRHDIYRHRSPRREEWYGRGYEPNYGEASGRDWYDSSRDRYQPDYNRSRWHDRWNWREGPGYRPRSPIPSHSEFTRAHAEIYRPVSPRSANSPKPPSSKIPSPTEKSVSFMAHALPLHSVNKTRRLSLERSTVDNDDGNKQPPTPKIIHSPTPLLPDSKPRMNLAKSLTPSKQSGQPSVPKPIPFWSVRTTKPSRSREEESKVYGRTFVGCGHQDDYDMTRKLGEGTFGEVHKAKHRPTGHDVALKRILMHNEKEGMPVTALREIKILKSLKHKNVIELLDMFVNRSGKIMGEPMSVYMVFPYMDHDLAGLLENPRVTLAPSHIKLYMKQLLEGTEYMHKNRILHRDMKAANLLISNDGSLKIADFGLARSYDPAAATMSESDSRHRDRRYTNCVVTRWYRPPELLLGARRYGGEIDMWGIGCVLGEMYHRRPILCGDSDLDQLEKIWTMCGTPNQHSWPNFDLLPGCDGVKHFTYRPKQMKSMFETLGAETYDLLDKLLTCNPQDRINATEALRHDFFWTDPLPADPKTMPQYEASHEFDKRGRRHLPPAPPGAAHQQSNGPSGPNVQYVRGPPPRESFRQGPYQANGHAAHHTLPQPTHINFPRHSHAPPPPAQFGPPLHFHRGHPPLPPAPMPYHIPPGHGPYGNGLYGNGPHPFPDGPHAYPSAPPPAMLGHQGQPPRWGTDNNRSSGLPSRMMGNERYSDRKVTRRAIEPGNEPLPYD